MEKYAKYCTEEQTLRAQKLAAPIVEMNNLISYNEFLITTQQMINWLREEQEIEIVYSSGNDDVYFDAWRNNHNIASVTMDKCDYYEAELAIIDKVLDFLERGEVI